MAVTEDEKRNSTVEISGLRFTYPGIDGHPPPGSKPLIEDFSLKLNSSDRCLLVGSNGAGKTTILKILGGKHMVEPRMVRVLGRSAFHDTDLTSSGDLCYLGGEWRRDVAFAGFEVPIQMDISAEKMIFGVAGIDPQRRDELVKLGAFLAGALLAETNFRTQIEADIRPFRGLLLGLFFVTTGTSIDMEVLFREWPNVLTLLAGLILIKTLIITALGPRVGLTLQESVRIGFLLSQGGEFAFVVFSLANMFLYNCHFLLLKHLRNISLDHDCYNQICRLGVLPFELNKLLIIVVVLSMALTPTLNQLGRRASDFIDEKLGPEGKLDEDVNFAR